MMLPPWRPELALPQFLELLATYPDATTVLQRAIDGPMARFDATAGFIWIERDGALHAIAGVNTTEALDERYAHIPLDLDLPAPLAYRASEVIVLEVPGADEQFHDLTADAELWNDFERGGPFACLLQFPIVSRGRSMGVIGIACGATPELDTLDVAFLDGLGAALGLWLTHPSTPVSLGPDAPTSAVAEGDLSPRQRQILSLVLAERSTAAIAARLGCSVSTVKQDLQRAQRTLQAAGRLAAAERARDLGLLADTPDR